MAQGGRRSRKLDCGLYYSLVLTPWIFPTSYPVLEPVLHRPPVIFFYQFCIQALYLKSTLPTPYDLTNNLSVYQFSLRSEGYSKKV
jgi:hypothetical protein